MVFSINKQGGTRFCSLLHLNSGPIHVATMLRARHIPGTLSVIADRLSRQDCPVNTKWSLHPTVLALTFDLSGIPTVNMFATIKKKHSASPVHVSDSRGQCTGGECSVTTLLGEVGVHVPSISPDEHGLLRCTQKGAVILIAPCRTSQQWFPHLVLLCVNQPLLMDGKRVAAAPRRSSTNRMYYDRWLRFAGWAA